VEVILKKLDLNSILEKEMDLWCQTNSINSSNTSVDEISTSNSLSKVSDNNLTNKISETIQHIKIKKQNDFYMSQMPRKEVKNAKAKKLCIDLPKQVHSEVELQEDSNEEGIFVDSPRKIVKNISKESSILSKSSCTTFSGSYIHDKNEVSHASLQTSLDTGKMAKLKLSAFKFKKKLTKVNNSQSELNIPDSSPIQNQPCYSNIFSAEDDDLSYLDID